MIFSSAHAQGSDWQSALKECIHEVGNNFDATIGFLYVTDVIAPHLSQILLTLKRETGIEDWVGSAGPGILGISGAGGRAYFDVPAISLMTGRIPKSEFTMLPSIATVETGEFTNKSDEKYFSGPPLVLLHADHANEDVLEILDEIATETDGYLIGGLTLSETPKHHVAGEVTGGGVSGVLFDSKIPVATSLTQGCRPIGQVHEVTECSDNFIIRLDGRRATDVLQDDIGEMFGQDIEKAAGHIHVALPVLGSDTGDYVVRNLIGFDPQEGIIAIAAPLEHRDHVMFVSRDLNAAQDDLAQMVAKLEKRAGKDIKGGVYISCIARGPHMFGELDAEIKIIENRLGNVPITGLYANGEISNNQLYSYTGVLTLFT